MLCLLRALLVACNEVVHGCSVKFQLLFFPSCVGQCYSLGKIVALENLRCRAHTSVQDPFIES